jgi:uncharacterized protein (TIGR03437 family)
LQAVPLVSVSAASFSTTAIAAESILAAFGLNLATGVEVATTVPLPTNLLGTVVQVKDILGVTRDAGLFFVAPGQINYEVPPGTAEGDAMVTVIKNGIVAAIGTMKVNKVGPGLISANSNGVGVAAAVVVRVSGGVQSFEAVATFDPNLPGYVPIESDMGPAGDEIYLLLYGTGFRGNTGLPNVTAMVGDTSPAVFYAGEAPGFIGLDQANLGPLSRTLIGKKLVNIVLTVDGIMSNTVQISIK